MSTLEVVGFGCRRCIGLLKNTEEALRQSGRTDPVEKVTNCNRILTLDPWALPALAVDGKVVVAGCLATTAEIRQLLVTKPDKSNLSATRSPGERP